MENFWIALSQYHHERVYFLSTYDKMIEIPIKNEENNPERAKNEANKNHIRSNSAY